MWSRALQSWALVSVLFAGVDCLASETRAVDLTTSGQIASTGVEASSAISGDGRFVAFTSSSGAIGGNLPAGPFRIYLRDMLNETTILVSQPGNGTFPTEHSQFPSLSMDGRFCVFESRAALVPDWAPGATAIFLYDRSNASIECVSRDENGVASVAFLNESGGNRVSAEGRRVVFTSASPLTAADGNSAFDVYVRDRFLNQTVLVSATAGGASGNGPSQAHSISADGTKVLFTTTASNLAGTAGVGMFVKDLNSGVIQRVDVDANGTPLVGATNIPDAILSPDGGFVAFTCSAPNPQIGDFDNQLDVYLVDLATHAVEVVSRASDGSASNGPSQDPDVSWGGRYVTYLSNSTNVVGWDVNGQLGFDVVLHDRATHRSVFGNVSTNYFQGNSGSCTYPSISDDGRYSTFVSWQSGLVPNDSVAGSEVIYRDRLGFASMGYGKPGATGIPQLSGAGSVAPGGAGSLSLVLAAANRPALLMVALDRTYAQLSAGPLSGTILATASPLLVLPFSTGPNPLAPTVLPYLVPANVLLPPELYMQVAVSDLTASNGVAVSNGLGMGL